MSEQKDVSSADHVLEPVVYLKQLASLSEAGTVTPEQIKSTKEYKDYLRSGLIWQEEIKPTEEEAYRAVTKMLNDMTDPVNPHMPNWNREARNYLLEARSEIGIAQQNSLGKDQNPQTSPSAHAGPDGDGSETGKFDYQYDPLSQFRNFDIADPFSSHFPVTAFSIPPEPVKLHPSWTPDKLKRLEQINSMINSFKPIDGSSYSFDETPFTKKKNDPVPKKVESDRASDRFFEAIWTDIERNVISRKAFEALHGSIKKLMEADTGLRSSTMEELQNEFIADNPEPDKTALEKYKQDNYLSRLFKNQSKFLGDELKGPGKEALKDFANKYGPITRLYDFLKALNILSVIEDSTDLAWHVPRPADTTNFGAVPLPFFKLSISDNLGQEFSDWWSHVKAKGKSIKGFDACIAGFIALTALGAVIYSYNKPPDEEGRKDVFGTKIKDSGIDEGTFDLGKAGKYSIKGGKFDRVVVPFKYERKSSQSTIAGDFGLIISKEGLMGIDFKFGLTFNLVNEIEQTKDKGYVTITLTANGSLEKNGSTYLYRKSTDPVLREIKIPTMKEKADNPFSLEGKATYNFNWSK